MQQASKCMHASRWPEKDLHGELVEKRAIETPDARYDPNLVPPEWLQWLKQTRRAPPSPEEILQCDPGPTFAPQVTTSHRCISCWVHWVSQSLCNWRHGQLKYFKDNKQHSGALQLHASP